MPRGKHGNHARGARHHRWAGESRIIGSNGYAKVRVGKTHPLADSNGYAYEHLVIWAAAGRPLPCGGEVVHHENHEKTDNRIENLRLTTRAEHNAHHVAERKRDARGRLLAKERPNR